MKTDAESTPASHPDITINAPGIDTAALVNEIRAAVERKTREGVYSDPRIARAERSNLMNLKGEENFLSFYIECLRDAVFVDINDFEIFERRRRFGKGLIALKKGIWNLLKFYTYRLWSQQNQINGLLLTALETAEARSRERIAELEARIAALERAAEEQSGE